MKRLLIAFFAVAALSGCSKSEVSSDVGGKTTFTIYVSAPSDNVTKTSFDESTYEVSWSKGDALAVIINGETYKFVNETGGNAFTCADFTPVEGTEYAYELIYPYSSDLIFTMSGGVKTPMYGTATTVGGDAPEITMKQLSALIKVTVKNESEQGESTLSSLRIERADGGVLGGKHHIVDGQLQATENAVAYTEVNNQSKKIAAGSSVDMFLQCAPFTAESGTTLNISYTVNGKAYQANKTFTKEVEFVAGKVNRTSVSFKEETDNAIYVDFGDSDKTTSGWNNITKVNAEGVKLQYLDGTDSGVAITVGSGWSVYKPVGGESGYATYNEIQYPITAWSDAFMFSGSGEKTMTFSGLDSGKAYKFTIAAFRWNGTSTARATNYWLVGKTTTDSKKVYQGTKVDGKDSLTKNIENHFAVFENVTPDAEGNVVLNVTADLIGKVQEAHVSAVVIGVAE